MSQRNFPPSFWNSQHYQGAASHHGAGASTSSELYPEHPYPHPDAWYHQYSAASAAHHAHAARAVHDYHHHHHGATAAAASAMAAQYGGLLLPGSRLHVGAHAQCKAMDWQHPSLDASPYSSYPSMSGKLTC